MATNTFHYDASVPNTRSSERRSAISHSHAIGWLLVLATAVLVGAICSYAVKELASVPEQIWQGDSGQFVANTPMMAFTTLFTLTLFPATFGLALVLGAALVAIVMPFLRGKDIGGQGVYPTSVEQEHFPEAD